MSGEPSDENPVVFGRVGQNMLAKAQVELLFKDEQIKPYFVALRDLTPEEALVATTGQDASGRTVSKSRIAEWRENSGRAQAAAEAVGQVLDRFNMETGEEQGNTSQQEHNTASGPSAENGQAPRRAPSPASRVAVLQLLATAKAILEEPISYFRTRRGSTIAGGDGVSPPPRRFSSASITAGNVRRKLSDSGITGPRRVGPKNGKLAPSETYGFRAGRKNDSCASESDEYSDVQIEDEGDEDFSERGASMIKRKVKATALVKPTKRGRRRKRPPSVTSSARSSASPKPAKKTQGRKKKEVLQKRRHSAGDGDVRIAAPERRGVHNKKSLTIPAGGAASYLSELSDDDSAYSAGGSVSFPQDGSKAHYQKVYAKSLSPSSLVVGGFREADMERQKGTYRWDKEFPTSAPPLMTITHDIPGPAGATGAGRVGQNEVGGTPASADLKREVGTAIPEVWQGPKIRFGAGKKRAAPLLLPSTRGEVGCRFLLVDSPCTFTGSEGDSSSPVLRPAAVPPRPLAQHQHEGQQRDGASEESSASPVIHPVHGDINRTYVRYMEDVQLLSQHKRVKEALMGYVERALSGPRTPSLALVRARSTEASSHTPGQWPALTSPMTPQHIIVPPQAATSPSPQLTNGNHQAFNPDGVQAASYLAGAGVPSLPSAREAVFPQGDRTMPDPKEFFSRQDEEILVRWVRDFVAAARTAYMARALHG